MTDEDRELLEAAARAAGLYTVGDWESFGGFAGLRVREDDAPGGYCWNPLQDDAQALRLAVSLGLVVDCSRPSAALPFAQHRYEQEGYQNHEAATRRAIVRAAASMSPDLAAGGREGVR